MQIQKLKTLIFLALWLGSIQAKTIKQSCSLKNKHYSSLSVNGDLSFENLIVKDNITIKGSIRGDTLKCKTIEFKGPGSVKWLEADELRARGPFEGKKIQVTGTSIFFGWAKIKNAVLNKVQFKAPANVDHLVSIELQAHGPFESNFIQVDTCVFFDVTRIKDGRSNKIEFKGPASVKYLQAAELQAHGFFRGKNTFVTGTSVFNGGVHLDNAGLHEVEIASRSATLIDVRVKKDIRMKKPAEQSSIQILELHGNSIISGNVIFEEPGTVHLFGDAKIEGQVVNAEVIRK